MKRVRAVGLMLLVTLAMAGPGWARLGENQVQFSTRYGPPRSLQGQTNLIQALQPNCTQVYDSQGWVLTATFVAGQADQVDYIKPGGQYSAQEIQAVLQAEAGGGRWYQIDGNNWTNSNGSVCQKPMWEPCLRVRSARLVRRQQAVEATKRAEPPPPRF